MSEASSRNAAEVERIRRILWKVFPGAVTRQVHSAADQIARRPTETPADGPCVAESCVNLPIGKTKHGWCPFCGDCLREMLIPLRPTETPQREV